MTRISPITTLTTALIAAIATSTLAISAGHTQPTANFESFTIGNGSASASVGGTTGGTTSIPAIIGSTDRSGNKCLGFGDPNPDHIMTLKQPLSKLTLKVNSGGRDTTLVVRGPNGALRCGDDTGSKKDASLVSSDWEPGVYQVWVGSMESGVRSNYRLSAQTN